MDIIAFRNFCLSLPEVKEETPFGPDVLVFKVANKMFATADLIAFSRINLKCEPEKAIEDRLNYEAVIPGYHMNKKHWNTILMEGSISQELIKDWTLDSYLLVVEKLKRKDKQKVLELFKIWEIESKA